ncbi:MAG: hypothetical protein ACKVP4_14780 [Hyphomicrobium sp.]
MAHALASTDLTRRTERFVDLATQYFAYMAGVSIAVGVAAVTIVYSAQTALTYVDDVAFPARHATESRPASTRLPAQPDRPTQEANTFAMLPSSMPIKFKNDVMSSNF